MEKVEMKMSRDLMEAVRARAKEEGRDSEEVVEDAVRGYMLRQGAVSQRSLPEIFEAISRHQKENGVEPLSEKEAMRLAVEEQHAWRRKQREHKTAT